MRPVHDRMPVILDRRHFEQWLDPGEQDAGALALLLRPFAVERMRSYPVVLRVNSTKNDDAYCLEPAA